MKFITEENISITSHQFGYREKHSTIDQIHRITDIERSLEENKLCSTVFLDINSYISDRAFR